MTEEDMIRIIREENRLRDEEATRCRMYISAFAFIILVGIFIYGEFFI